MGSGTNLGHLRGITGTSLGHLIGKPAIFAIFSIAAVSEDGELQ